MSALATAEPPAPAAKTKKAITGLRISPKLWFQVRFHALMTGVSATELTEKALTQYLERVGHQTVPETVQL